MSDAMQPVFTEPMEAEAEPTEDSLRKRRPDPDTSSEDPVEETEPEEPEDTVLVGDRQLKLSELFAKSMHEIDVGGESVEVPYKDLVSGYQELHEIRGSKKKLEEDLVDISPSP